MPSWTALATGISRSAARTARSEVKKVTSVNQPPSPWSATVTPSTCASSCSPCSTSLCRAASLLASMTLPCRTRTNPAWAELPPLTTRTSGHRCRRGGPASRFSTAARQPATAGRSSLAAADASLSKRKTATSSPPSVIPAVSPSQPVATAPSWSPQRSNSRRTPAASLTLPCMTWMNMAPPLRPDCPAQATRHAGQVKYDNPANGQLVPTPGGGPTRLRPVVRLGLTCFRRHRGLARFRRHRGLARFRRRRGLACFRRHRGLAAHAQADEAHGDRESDRDDGQGAVHELEAEAVGRVAGDVPHPGHPDPERPGGRGEQDGGASTGGSHAAMLPASQVSGSPRKVCRSTPRRSGCRRSVGAMGARRRPGSPCRGSPLGRQAEGARDVGLEDLAGPLVQAHPADEPGPALDAHLGHVAVAAEHLDGPVGDPADHLGGHVL